MGEDRDMAAGILVRERSGRSRSILRNFVREMFHRNWMETQAEVRDCTAVHSHFTTSPDTSVARGLAAYVVGFTYVVDGKSYEGILNSPDEVREGDTFVIRCDPRQPEKNNTFDSETNWTVTYTKIFSILLALIMLYGFLRSYFIRS
jgi:hypothetical protein